MSDCRDAPAVSHRPLPAGARRFLVAGTSGSGKTTTAARIAATLGVRHTEMDGLFHGPDWTPRPTFVADVHAVAEADGWALEYQYSQVRPFLLERADVLVWLDLPVAVVMWQVTRRTIARRRSRAELWNGNVEAPLRTIFREHGLRISEGRQMRPPVERDKGGRGYAVGQRLPLCDGSFLVTAPVQHEGWCENLR